MNLNDMFDCYLKAINDNFFDISYGKNIGNCIKNVIFNNPATIVQWADGTKTIVKCQKGDTYNPELGLAMCIVKKACGNSGRYNDVFKKWIPKEEENANNNQSE